MPLTFEAARAAGGDPRLGGGDGFDDTVDLPEILLSIAHFFRHESCGQCVPCRIGTERQAELLARLKSGQLLGSLGEEMALMRELGQAMRDASICGLGQTASSAIESALARFPFSRARRRRSCHEPGRHPVQPAAGVAPAAAAAAAAGGAAGRARDRRQKRGGGPGATVLEACRQAGAEVPTLCFLETLTPVNACRLCVVEQEGARVLVPACSRRAEPGMKIKTRSERVDTSRRLVLELLASAVDLETAPSLAPLFAEYGATPRRFGANASTVAQPILEDNQLFARDYGKCVLCYKCVEACGVDAQNTFAIGIAGRGFEAHVATELKVPLPESGCVFCGNCIAVCPTGALVPTHELELRRAGEWAPERQTVTDTICPYCGVGCTLSLHVQDEKIVKVSSPFENSVTAGNLCVKGRFGWEFVNNKPAGT